MLGSQQNDEMMLRSKCFPQSCQRQTGAGKKTRQEVLLQKTSQQLGKEEGNYSEQEF